MATSATLAASIGHWADKTIQEYREINKLVIEEYRTKIVEQSASLEKLRQENSKLRKRTTTYRIVRPDGTVEERSSSEVESEREIATAVRMEYEEKMRSEVAAVRRELISKLNETTEIRSKLRVSGGVTSTFRHYFLWSSYDIYPGIHAGAGVILPFQPSEAGEYTGLLGIGINL